VDSRNDRLPTLPTAPTTRPGPVFGKQVAPISIDKNIQADAIRCNAPGRCIAPGVCETGRCCHPRRQGLTRAMSCGTLRNRGSASETSAADGLQFLTTLQALAKARGWRQERGAAVPRRRGVLSKSSDRFPFAPASVRGEARGAGAETPSLTAGVRAAREDRIGAEDDSVRETTRQRTTKGRGHRRDMDPQPKERG